MPVLSAAVDSREPQVTFYSLGGLENPSLGSGPEKIKSQNKSYPPLVPIFLNNAGLLGGGRVSRMGVGTSYMLVGKHETVRHKVL